MPPRAAPAVRRPEVAKGQLKSSQVTVSVFNGGDRARPRRRRRPGPARPRLQGRPDDNTGEKIEKTVDRRCERQETPRCCSSRPSSRTPRSGPTSAPTTPSTCWSATVRRLQQERQDHVHGQEPDRLPSATPSADLALLTARQLGPVRDRVDGGSVSHPPVLDRLAPARQPTAPAERPQPLLGDLALAAGVTISSSSPTLIRSAAGRGERHVVPDDQRDDRVLAAAAARRSPPRPAASPPGSAPAAGRPRSCPAAPPPPRRRVAAASSISPSRRATNGSVGACRQVKTMTKTSTTSNRSSRARRRPPTAGSWPARSGTAPRSPAQDRKPAHAAGIRNGSAETSTEAAGRRTSGTGPPRARPATARQCHRWGRRAARASRTARSGRSSRSPRRTSGSRRGAAAGRCRASARRRTPRRTRWRAPRPPAPYAKTVQTSAARGTARTTAARPDAGSADPIQPSRSRARHRRPARPRRAGSARPAPTRSRRRSADRARHPDQQDGRRASFVDRTRPRGCRGAGAGWARSQHGEDRRGVGR